MPLPASFEAMLRHPAPGLRFPVHKKARACGCIFSVEHRVCLPASKSDLKAIQELTSHAPSVQAELLEFYSKHNGMYLCCVPDRDSGFQAALTFLGVEGCQSTTAELNSPDWTYMYGGIEDVYAPGNFIAIAGNETEETRLVLFTRGQHEGKSLVGRVCYVALDPVVSFVEPIANSFFDLLDKIASDPAQFLLKIGYSHWIATQDGEWFWPPDGYVADTRGLPNVKTQHVADPLD